MMRREVKVSCWMISPKRYDGSRNTDVYGGQKIGYRDAAAWYANSANRVRARCYDGKYQRQIQLGQTH